MTIDRYIGDFERLLGEAEQADPDGRMLQNYLTLGVGTRLSLARACERTAPLVYQRLGSPKPGPRPPLKRRRGPSISGNQNVLTLRRAVGPSRRVRSPIQMSSCFRDAPFGRSSARGSCGRLAAAGERTPSPGAFRAGLAPQGERLNFVVEIPQSGRKRPSRPRGQCRLTRIPDKTAFGVDNPLREHGGWTCLGD